MAAPSVGAKADYIAPPNKTITTQSVGIQMFTWPWVSLKTECTSVLGPEHVDWILVSPPQEDISGTQWWTHYQPVSYKLTSQLGTEQQFTDMVSACNKAGVQVIVDAVINHMANSAGKGFAGTSFSKYNYPGLYDPLDFHNELAPNDPNACYGDIVNYDAPFETTHCELGSLPDLATEKDNVRQTIAGYLNHLIDLGVSGFRIDAAKHIGLTDLTAIHKLLKPVNGATPYFLQESIGSAEYNAPWTANGDVFAWDYQAQFANIFSGETGFARPTDARSALIGDPNKTIIMVSNHDTEHHGPSAITYMDPQKYLTASAFLLADSLGKPMLYTGYAFSMDNMDVGPAVKSGDVIAPAVCPTGTASLTPQKKYRVGTFICMERWTAMKGMIQWHHEVGTSPMANVNYGQQVLSFTRGSGFFAMNGNQQLSKITAKTTMATGLPKGVYCDVVSGGAKAISHGKCLGTQVTVAADGSAKVAIPAMTAIALDSANKLK
jgi:alpha-amylase